MSREEIIDPDGDLMLIVGSEPHAKEFKVSRSVLRLCSKVWKAMFAGAFSEASQKSVSLPDDNPEALSVLLRLAHYQFSQFPAAPSLELLGGIAQLCDKYDMFELVRERFAKWLGVLPQNLSTWNYHNAEPGCVLEYKPDDDEEAVRLGASALWIAWTCRNYELFEDTLTDIMRRVAPTELADVPELPLGCYPFIEKEVLKTVQEINDAAYIALIVAQDTSALTPCAGATHTTRDTWNRCELLRLGLATRLLSILGLPADSTNRPPTTRTFLSLRMMSIVCEDIRLDYDGMNEFGSYNHRHCYTHFDAIMDILDENVEDPIGDGIEKEFAEFFPAKTAELEKRKVEKYIEELAAIDTAE